MKQSSASSNTPTLGTYGHLKPRTSSNGPVKAMKSAGIKQSQINIMSSLKTPKILTMINRPQGDKIVATASPSYENIGERKDTVMPELDIKGYDRKYPFGNGPKRNSVYTSITDLSKTAADRTKESQRLPKAFSRNSQNGSCEDLQTGRDVPKAEV